MDTPPFTPLTDLVSLQGKTAVITGAAAGMGAATAQRYAEAGAVLHLLDIDHEKLIIEQTALRQSGATVHIAVIDLAEKSEIDAFWAKTEDEPIDILVNNAGIFPFCNFLETNEALVQKVMDINFTSVYWMCQHFIRRRLREKQPGAIVNISSIEAHLPFKEDLAHYTTGKAAVIALTRALARDYGAKGIRVNVVLPGGILTAGTREAAKGAWKDLKLLKDGVKFMGRLPLGRMGQADEVARVNLMLATELSSYVTGAVVPVDGGFLSA